MSGWTTVWVLVVVVGLGSAAWTGSPKGPNQIIWRTCALLTLACCYLMWFCVYMAQLHPLIQPKRSDVRFFD
ncbi:H(+)-transporting V0 sector ATPase subunit e [Malassezia sp. CBS 17886]|nr:H(+)-transporting V0 sector ATPase subunit e [Malassezia sp. CBS 17886]